MSSVHHKTEFHFFFCLSEKDDKDGFGGGRVEELSPLMSSLLGNRKREKQSRYRTSNLFLSALEDSETNKLVFA